MKRSTNQRQVIGKSMGLLVLLGLTLLALPVAAQVFDPGPSASSMFDSVINVPPNPDIELSAVIGGDGLTTQLNVFDNGSVERFFTAESGAEVNITGGSVGGLFRANSGSEINISGGDVGAFFNANDGSLVDITGGSVDTGFDAGSGSEVSIRGGASIGRAFTASAGSVVRVSGGSIEEFLAVSGSEVNFVGHAFLIDGVPIADLPVNQAFTIADRDVTLSGRLANGNRFSFNLNPNPPVFEPDGDYFDPGATVTVRLVDILRGDQGDGAVNFADIQWLIGVLNSRTYDPAADINLDGEVNFFDIAPFIQILSGN